MYNQIPHNLPKKSRKLNPIACPRAQKGPWQSRIQPEVGTEKFWLTESTIRDSFYPYHMILCLKCLGSETKVLTYNCFSNEEGINCTASNLCHVSKGAMLSAQTEIKWKHRYIPSHVVAKGWNETTAALVYGLMLPFAVNSSNTTSNS